LHLAIVSGTAASLLQTISAVALMYSGAVSIIGEQLTVGELMAFTAVNGLVTGAALGLIGLWDWER
jgi:ABC-type bacteriocin/lantibiotic exporter with double-glycine peptidase domain